MLKKTEATAVDEFKLSTLKDESKSPSSNDPQAPCAVTSSPSKVECSVQENPLTDNPCVAMDS